MNIVLPALAVAFAAFCVWLGVRVYNRRERWAKWTAVAVVGLPVLYVLSFGPACWMADGTEAADPLLWTFYSPIEWVYYHAPRPVRDAIERYATLCI
jgi:hypothetical protein